ncbi:MAG: hypothetical protein ACI9MR_004363 [Myxococcota bacterium]|jgi:hypothetical protein
MEAEGRFFDGIGQHQCLARVRCVVTPSKSDGTKKLARSPSSRAVTDNAVLTGGTSGAQPLRFSTSMRMNSGRYDGVQFLGTTASL